jgi:hypothetical protein
MMNWKGLGRTGWYVIEVLLRNYTGRNEGNYFRKISVVDETGAQHFLNTSVRKFGIIMSLSPVSPTNKI